MFVAPHGGLCANSVGTDGIEIGRATDYEEVFQRFDHCLYVQHIVYASQLHWFKKVNLKKTLRS